MDTKTKSYWHKLLTYPKDNIRSVKKMQIVRFKVAALIGMIVLAGIIGFHPVISLLLRSYVIQSSGSIRYGPLQTPPLHVEGKYIKDEDGSTVFLRGVWKAEYIDTSTGWWTAPGVWPGSMAPGDNYATWDESAVRAQMEVMSNEWGINVIFTFIWGNWWLENANKALSQHASTTDIGSVDAIKETLRIAQNYGIYFQIRLYSPQAPDYYGGPGEGRVEFPYDTGEAYCSKVWSQQDFVNFWVNVATELKDYPNIILCLFDEPVTLYQTTPDPISGKSWFDTVIETVDAIRATGFTGLVLLQWGYCGDCYWMEQFHDYLAARDRSDILTNLVFSNHIYRFHGTFDGIGGSTDYNILRDFMYHNNEPPHWPIVGLHYNRILNELQLPVIATAVGAYNGAIDEAEYTSFKNVLSILNELEAGYAAYQWHRSELAWAIQQHTVAIQPPNRAGQALIDAIAAGKA